MLWLLEGDTPASTGHTSYNRVAMCRRLPFAIALITIGIVGLLFAQSGQNNQYPRFAELSPLDSARLDRQRAVIADAVKQHFGVPRLTRTKADLPVLQRLIDGNVFNKSQTYQLQCLGVAFGDVLANELPLRWVMITGEYGTDPTLRFKKTVWNVNALTMISKRIENDERVNVSQTAENYPRASFQSTEQPVSLRT